MVSFSVTVGANCEGVTQLKFADGRMNNHDGQETAAVYCNENGGVDVWTVSDSVGHFAFTATKQELARVPEKSSETRSSKQVAARGSTA